MQKTKLGISVGLMGALCYFMGYLGGTLVIALLAGYVLLFEENPWLKQTAVKAVVVSIGLSALSSIINLVPDFFNTIFSFINLFNFYPTLGKTGSIFGVISTVISYVRTALMLILGVKALKQSTIAIPVIDKFIEKHFA